jgi:DNA processing protein
VTAGDERAALVALLRTGKRPWVEYSELIEERGSAITVLHQELEADAEPGGQTSLLPTDTTPSVESLLEQAHADVERWTAQGMQPTTLLDPSYPPNLRAVHDRPPMVFVNGKLTHEDAHAVAVVGTREATDGGRQRADAIARHLVAKHYTVISGLAAGIDTAAHQAALSANGRTVAVIGTGLARSYPPQNHALQQRIAKECAVVSQFWPDSPPTKRSFPMRNAVISGIALASVVVEASETSGARMLTRLALAQGRPVFLTNTLVEQQQWAQHAATLPGAHVVREPVEITDALERLTDAGALVA